MLNQFSRTQLLLGKEAMDKLKNSRVAVFGIGGVGGYVCEALVRSGVGHFDLIDDDKVCLTNLNRQIIATRKTVGQYKIDVMKERMLDINPDIEVNVHKCFFLPENAEEFPFAQYDFRNTVIIMTSNAGAQAIIDPKRLGFGNKENQEEEKMLLRALKINDCIFFGSHPYNLITISGVLPQDREEIIKHLDSEMAAWDRDQPGFLDTVWKRTDM